MVTTEDIMKETVQRLERYVERCDKKVIHTAVSATENVEKLYREKTIAEQIRTERINQIRKLTFEFIDKCTCNKKDVLKH